MTTTEKAISWMEQIAADNTHGYSQSVRWGPSYDCSSMVISAWQQAGVPVKDRGATFTGNMYEVFLDCGFKNVTSLVNLTTGANLERGDVLLNKANHTAMYCGNGKVVHARSSEGTSDTSDNSGNEIRVQSYWNYPWDVVLRYPSTTASDTETEVETSTEDAGTTEEETVDYEIPQPDIPYSETDISDIPGATHNVGSADEVSVSSTPIPTAVVEEPGVHVCRPSEYSYFVFAMQYLLKENGYWPQADGYFALDTSKWFLKFQREHPPLEVDCQCGEQSWNELFKDKVLMITDEGYAVRAMQYLLKAQDYFMYVDGIFGSQAYQQLIRFQESRGLPPSGTCDKETWNELIKI